jgi:NAD-dependent DNA ligase
MMQTITEKISQRRGQLLIHSCIYYHLDTSIVEDYQYDAWARELKELVKKYPEEAKEARFANEFSEWDKDDCLSGYNLPISGEWVTSMAKELLKLCI